MRMTLLTLTLALASLPALGQTGAAPTSDQKELTLDGARTVLAAATVVAKNDDAKTGAIAVVDRSGNLIAWRRAGSGHLALHRRQTGRGRSPRGRAGPQGLRCARSHAGRDTAGGHA
ncbi:MAG: hypothetical protein ABJC13_12205 [Acidobacteriota bacterium]